MIVTLDFETYYSQSYSLRKMSEVEYILSPLFQPIMVAVKLGDTETRVVIGEQAIRATLESIPWDTVAMLAHNVRFDGAILYWHYGIRPKLYLDTLSMARALTHPLTGSSSLANVSKYLGLPAKGDAVVRAIGKRREDFSYDELDEYAEYCAHDTDLARQIFDKFMGVGFPSTELAVIDMAVRAYIEPQARLDSFVLAEHLNHVRAIKAQTMARMSYVTPDVFSSNIKFAALLESLGVDVPMKLSPITGKEIPAIAKNDRAFKELSADPDQSPEVQAACACRLGVKSTIEETRTQTMLNLSRLEWEGMGIGWMPVPYRYYGAHTGRFSGDGGYNFANLKRGSRIREAIEAPAGYRVVHRDSSQIECRTLATVANCMPLWNAFRQGRDVYSEFASRFYSQLVNKRTHPRERFVGKTCVLGLGYGMGPPKLRHTLFIGNGGDSVDLPEGVETRLVYFYRNEYREITQLWAACDQIIERMILAKQPWHPAHHKWVNEPMPVIPAIDIVMDGIRLPNGLAIQYPDMRAELGPDGRYEFLYDARNEHATKKIYGAKMTENIIQALTRIMLTDVALRVKHETGYIPFMSTYDSHDYIVPESEAEWFDDYLAVQFAIRPPWLPSVPLASEGGWGRNLLEAEKGVNQ